MEIALTIKIYQWPVPGWPLIGPELCVLHPSLLRQILLSRRNRYIPNCAEPVHDAWRDNFRGSGVELVAHAGQDLNCQRTVDPPPHVIEGLAEEHPVLFPIQEQRRYFIGNSPILNPKPSPWMFTGDTSQFAL